MAQKLLRMYDFWGQLATTYEKRGSGIENGSQWSAYKKCVVLLQQITNIIIQDTVGSIRHIVYVNYNYYR